MSFEAVINRLIPEGAVRAGVPPTLITQDGETIPAGQTDPLSRLNRSLERHQKQVRAKQEEQIKKQKDQMDYYKTLREAGYTPKAAFEAVSKGEMPTSAGGATDKETKTAAEVTKLTAETEKTKAATEKIKEETKQIPNNTKVLSQRIINKVANGEELTPGEQKVYDEVIKKYGKKSELDTFLDNKKKTGGDAEPAANDTAEYIPMVDPQGKKTKVHKDDVQKALKKGWKRR